jgi:hypothetical protein
MTSVVENFMRIMAEQPLSLALCAMNLLLLWFLFKQNNQFTKTRNETTQAIMADCVSKEVMELVLKSLERDRETYRAMLPTLKGPEMPSVAREHGQ